MMQEVALVDYAMPLMRVERLAKEIHDLCLDGKYEEARGTAMQLVVESRLLQTTLRYMSEEQEKLNEVAKDHQSRPEAVHRTATKKFATNGARPR